MIEAVVNAGVAKNKLGFPLNGIVTPAMVEYRLAFEHAPELLRLLWNHGVSGASIFPGLTSVASTLAEQALWDQNP